MRIVHQVKIQAGLPGLPAVGCHHQVAARPVEQAQRQGADLGRFATGGGELNYLETAHLATHLAFRAAVYPDLGLPLKSLNMIDSLYSAAFRGSLERARASATPEVEAGDSRNVPKPRPPDR